MRAGRQRTESMAQRLAKKPVSEGFELWDKGYTLGAMRLFIFKAENSPPFHLGPILDAMAHLLLDLGELNDANENFGFAQEKYDLIQQPIVAKLMAVKGVFCSTQSAAAALEKLDELLREYDPARQAHTQTDAKVKSALSRVYHYRAELLTELKRLDEALADAIYSTTIGAWDRVHAAHNLAGELLVALGREAEAVEAFNACLAACPHYLRAYENILPLVRSDTQRSLNLLSRAIDVHPRAEFIRQKAFVLSEEGCDAEALEMLEACILNPPHEETEAVTIAGSSVPVFHLAKAAILADAGRVADALAAAQEALRLDPSNENATRMVADLNDMIANPQ